MVDTRTTLTGIRWRTCMSLFHNSRRAQNPSALLFLEVAPGSVYTLERRLAHIPDASYQCLTDLVSATKGRGEHRIPLAPLCYRPTAVQVVAIIMDDGVDASKCLDCGGNDALPIICRIRGCNRFATHRLDRCCQLVDETLSGPAVSAYASSRADWKSLTASLLSWTTILAPWLPRYRA